MVFAGEAISSQRERDRETEKLIESAYVHVLEIVHGEFSCR